MLTASLPIEPTLLRRYRYFESDDLDDTRERIAAVLQPHRLTPGSSRGGYSAYMDHVRIDSVGFGTIGYAGTMSVDAGEIEDYYLAILSLGGYADLNVGGQRTIAGPTQGVIVGPATRFGGTFSRDCEQFFVRIDRRAILAHTGHDHLQIEPTLDLTRPELQPWLAQLRVMASSPETVALAQRDRRIALEFERLVISLLLAGQPHHCQTRPGGTALVPRTVKRAEAYIVEHACEPITLADIALAAGVPVRTLLDGFQRFSHGSPMQLVRERRLERARDQLLHAREAERVADVALGCGFANLGRFAILYRETFGESPSDTLRRARRSAG
ncbi:MAG: HTH-type transcriptional activator RhaS [Burkholderia lata]|uniref:HTH-type transcriptional activator RhaS n=1 Tax=Burkholderia lata (strain ATCC 17760 / DSM 23089 / LMG 22485 / NCIMB 9086 / R18194 / 383) TaxID=482957 RepID=A0A833PUS8_BURL3|nr:anthranilate 1,2-dioxygenase regulatory protein AndR [Burkholderia lata]KAF1036764.1 MAG: HTH-type transcriptional activator RhaS [Burkholderia lata]